MAPTSNSAACSPTVGAITPVSRATVSSTTGGSGSLTCAIGRFTESRGTAASSPTPGSPVPDDCVKVMPDEAL